MASRRIDRRKHIVVEGSAKAEKFTSPQQGGGGSAVISRNRAKHGKELQRQLDEVRAALEERRGRETPVGVEAPRGFYLEFESPPGYELKLESLEQKRAGIELISVREIGKTTFATVFVPQGKIAFFVTRVEEYLKKTTERGNPKNQPLIANIEKIRLAVAENFWTDDPDTLPRANVQTWWEVWLRGDDEGVLPRFQKQAEAMGIAVGNRHLVFPERTVVLAQGLLDQFAASLDFLDTLAELRRPGGVGSFFTRQVSAPEQAKWVQDLLSRTKLPPKNAVAVCLLDTGVNRGHSLLAPVLEAKDMHACQPTWGVADHDGHGTQMAGIAAYGDLQAALLSSGPVELRHRLESAKILPPPPGANRKELYGAITAEGVGRAELAAPETARVISMAVTSEETRDRGQPTSWSAEVDKLCVGEDQRRLFFVSAGNVTQDPGSNYRAQNETDGIHDPGQAWNALTVGAYTERIDLDEPSFKGWTCVAQPGELSPTSTTSCVWQRQWPLKPELVMEGGNMARSSNGKRLDHPDSLAVLTTHHQPMVRQFAAAGDTSAAVSAAARFGAIVRAEYPEFWPETVRALLVDSAEWSEPMQMEIDADRKTAKIEHLLRCFGYGVPQLDRALWSGSNALTLVVQEELQPFAGDKSNEMHLHALPWPRDVLASLGETLVELRVTLSYFVEPHPASRGWKKRHRYASHGLRFAVQKPAESAKRFSKRVNGAARDADEQKVDTGDADGWLLKADLRGKGSLHHDRWEGTAADLATRQHVAVYPVIGWWRERRALGRSESKARYALVVSIRTPATDTDIYSAVKTLVQV